MARVCARQRPESVPGLPRLQKKIHEGILIGKGGDGSGNGSGGDSRTSEHDDPAARPPTAVALTNPPLIVSGSPTHELDVEIPEHELRRAPAADDGAGAEGLMGPTVPRSPSAPSRR